MEFYGHGTDHYRTGDILNELHDYPGFNPELEIDHFIEFFELPSIRVFSFKEESGCYIYDYVYKSKNYDTEQEFVNICILPTDLGKLHNNEEGIIPHVIFIKDLDKALNLSICPKCKFYVFQTKRYDNNRMGMTKFKQHVDLCDGKRPEKQLLVDELELPIAPGIFDNNTYLHLFGNNCLKKWKPDQYFMTYDLETVESPFENIPDTPTKTVASLSVLTVASVYHTKAGDKVSWFSIKKDGPDFMKKWMEEVVAYAKIICEDNKYEEWRIPHKNEVCHRRI
jgi:hypothetical protein